jgi:hypothetical protein
VFALQKELSREAERRYTQLTMAERMRLKFDSVVKRGSGATVLGR